jgi:ubiquinone/menaquinone biosynthesis C-methylase UbiE
MTTNSNESKYVFDPESAEEMVRLINLDRMTTRNMGGPLSGITHPSELRTVLDIGCGAGGWILDVAFAHPQIEAAGIDISKIMIDYANARARSEKLFNASFGIMDINQSLDFPDASFDLVNARFLFSVIKRDSWPAFIAECMRLLRPGGILRLTEMSDIVTTCSAQMQMSHLFHQFMWQNGYDFAGEHGRSMGITIVLPHLIRNAGYQNVRHIPHALEWSADTDAWSAGYHNGEIIARLMTPLLIKTGLATEEETVNWQQQMTIDMHSDGFCAMQYYMTVIGKKPE